MVRMIDTDNAAEVAKTVEDFNQRFSELGEPFLSFEVDWRVQHRENNRAIYKPLANPIAITRRLLEVMGGARWQVQYSPLPGAMQAELSIWDGFQWVKRAAIAPAITSGTDEASDMALIKAAAAFGIGLYLFDVLPVSVACDPKTGVPSSVPMLPRHYRRADDFQLSAIEVSEVERKIQVAQADRKNFLSVMGLKEVAEIRKYQLPSVNQRLDDAIERRKKQAAEKPTEKKG